MSIIGINAEMTRLTKGVEELQTEGVTEVKKAALTVTKQMMARTPVWTGETVGSYNAGLGGRSSTRSGGGSPPTNQGPDTPLGTEANRGTFEAKGLANILRVIGKLKDLERTVVISNGIDSAKWDLIDNGSAPTPDRARNPGGVSKLAIQATRAALGNWK